MFQKTSKHIALSLISLFAWGIPSANAIDVGVSPSRMELNIKGKQARSNSIQITNLSNKPTEIKAYVRNWTMDEKNELEDAPSNEQSLDQWIVFTPSRFTIPPRSTQTVRFAIRPKVKPAPGEYRAVIYLEEVVPDNSDSQVISTLGRVGVVVYGYTGEVKRIGTVNSVSVDTKSNVVKALFDVSNKGNAHIRMNGQYAIWRAANYPGAKATQPISGVGNPKTKLPANIVQAGVLELPPILPNNRRQLLLPLTRQLPPGNYVLDINGNLSGMAVDTGIPFTVPAATGNAQPTTKPVTSSKK
ncbi:MAG: fimbrial biogenesis chaperone [Hassallia sp.]